VVAGGAKGIPNVPEWVTFPALWGTSFSNLSWWIRNTAVLQHWLSDDLAARGRPAAGSHEDGLALASRSKEQG
jgi:hypothetical protein